MNAKDRKALGEYVRATADAMELRDWTFKLEHAALEDEDRTVFADITTTDGRKLAVIRFCEKFRELEPDDQRHVVVHELVHAHLAGLQEQVENDLDDLIGKPAATVHFRSCRRNLEYAVDGLAEALGKHLPLIDWPK